MPAVRPVNVLLALLLLVTSLMPGVLEAADREGQSRAANAAAVVPPAHPASPPLAVLPPGPAYNGGRILHYNFGLGRWQAYAMDPDGSNLVNLTNTTENECYNPCPNSFTIRGGPDGQIVFVSVKDGGTPKLYLMQPDGSGRKRLTSNTGSEYRPTWSPDGKQIGFWYYDPATQRHQLRIVDTSGSNQQVLVEFQEARPESNAVIADPDWSPDGTSIIFRGSGLEYESGNPPSKKTDTGLFVVTVATKALKYLGTNTENYADPAYSPDGTKLAFTYRFNPGSVNSTATIGVINADGSGNATQLTLGVSNENEPRWSPDGRRIVYTANIAGIPQLFVTTPDGAGASSYTPLYVGLHTASATVPDWTAYGSIAPPAIAMPYVVSQTGGVTGPATLNLATAGGGSPVGIAQAPGLRLAGAWGNYVVYQQVNAYGSYDVMAYNIISMTASLLSETGPNVMNTHPVLDGANVVWKQVAADMSKGTASATFFRQNLIDGTRQTLPFPANYFPDLMDRFAADAGRLVNISEGASGGQVVTFFGIFNASGEVATLPFAPEGLVGISDDLIAGFERGGTGLLDRLVAYRISDASREVVADGVDGGAALSGDTVAWVAGGQVYRRNMVEEMEPDNVASGIAAAVSGPMLTWLSAGGLWSSGQVDVAPYETGFDDAQGDMTMDLAATQPLRAQNIKDFSSIPVATLTEGTMCLIDPTDKRPVPACLSIRPGDGLAKIYWGYRYFVRTGDQAVLRFTDGSKVSFAAGVVFTLKPNEETSLARINQIIKDNFPADAVQKFVDSVKTYAGYPFPSQGQYKPGDLQISPLQNDLYAVSLASDPLAKTFNQVIKTLGKRTPSYLRRLADAQRHAGSWSSGMAGWLTKFNALARVFKPFDYPGKIAGLNDSFKAYLREISQRSPVGSDYIYTPEPLSKDPARNRQSVLLQMVALRGKANCLNTEAWSARFRPDDGALVFTYGTPGCGTDIWTPDTIASLITRVDFDALLEKVVLPALVEARDWLLGMAGLFTGDTASLILNVLPTIGAPKYVTITGSGRIRTVKSAVSAAAKLPPFKVTLPTTTILYVNTAFDIVAGTGGTFAALEGHPTLANNDDPLSAVWASVTDPVTPLPKNPSDPVVVPGAAIPPRPFVTSLAPNEYMLLAPGPVPIGIAFSDVMSQPSVLAAGQFTVTATSGAILASGALSSIPGSWSTDGLEVTLTPTAALQAGSYQLDVALTDQAVSLYGAALIPGLLHASFTVGAPIGPAGGTLGTAGGVTLTVPAGALSTPATLTAGPSPLFALRPGYLTSDWRFFDLGPNGTQFSAPITVTLPLDEPDARAHVFHWDGSDWKDLGGTVSADGKSITFQTSSFSIFAVAVPVQSGLGIYVPWTARGVAGA